MGVGLLALRIMRRGGLCCVFNELPGILRRTWTFTQSWSRGVDGSTFRRQLESKEDSMLAPARASIMGVHEQRDI